jgi:hypothetical protein
VATITKTIKIGNLQSMLNLIVHDALTIDYFRIGRGAPLQGDLKFVMMGGADFHLVEI